VGTLHVVLLLSEILYPANYKNLLLFSNPLVQHPLAICSFKLAFMQKPFYSTQNAEAACVLISKAKRTAEM
jgi:hypothetical protein